MFLNRPRWRRTGSFNGAALMLRLFVDASYPFIFISLTGAGGRAPRMDSTDMIDAEHDHRYG
jgi:hypothetical protein